MCKKLDYLIFSIILYTRCHCQLPGEQALPTLFLGPSNTCPSECVAAVRPCDCYTDGFIDCARKQLVNIPSTLPNCAKLINLQHNNITNISVFDFQSIRNADDLKLSFNKITQLPAGAFTHMPNLTKLYITNNLITNIEECTFQGLKSLEFLYMENNLISSIASEAFIGLFKLNTLSLMGNRLSTFNPNWFNGMPNLRSFSAPSNPWSCSCQLKSDFNSVITNNPNLTIQCPIPVFANSILSQTCITCNGPNNFTGRTIHTIQQSEFNDCNSVTQAQLFRNRTNVLNNYCQAKVDIIKFNFTNNVQVLFTTGANMDTSTTTLQRITTTPSNAANVTTAVAQQTRKHLPRWSIVLLIVGTTVMFFIIVIIIAVCLSRNRKPKTKTRSSGQSLTYTNSTNGKHEQDPLKNNTSI